MSGITVSDARCVDCGFDTDKDEHEPIRDTRDPLRRHGWFARCTYCHELREVTK